jgi:hypothetical protein
VITPQATDAVLCVPLQLSEHDALTRVHGGIRSLWRRRHTHATLRYKPLWEVRARLIAGNRRPSDSGQGDELVAVVDGLTGIARCRRRGSAAVDIHVQPVEGRCVVEPAVDSAQAAESAERVIRRTARRQRVRAAGVGEARLYYKPVWLVARAPGAPASYVVDAHSGVLARILA